MLLGCSQQGATESPTSPKSSAAGLPTPPPVPAQVPPDAAIPAPPPSVDPQTFVDIRDLAPDILLDLRYATPNNFAKRVVYPKARCLLRAPVAAALARVQGRLRPQGLQLLIWDCYRPFAVQEAFWELVPNPKYVAKPVRKRGKPWRGSKHNRGAAIDLSLADREGNPLEMPTDHDDFSERAHRDATGTSKAAAANARLLDKAMRAAGFAGIDTEWWHFDFEGWQDYPLSETSF